MNNIFSEDILQNDFFDLIKKDDALIVKLKKNNNVIISSWLNGGICHNMSNIVNQSISGNDYDDLSNGDFVGFQRNKFIDLGLIPEETTGLMTSACMDNYAISSKKYEQLEVTSIVTAWADKNGVKAGDKASFYEYNNHYFTHFGTINVIVIINSNLNDGGLVTAGITATEAKSTVLQDLKVESQYSTNIASGTGTDGLCIISNKDSDNHIENAGKHSKLGELIAKTVREATFEALYLQTFMSFEFQSTVLSRLSRFNISFYDFFKESSDEKLDYASKFYHFNNDLNNVAFVSSIVDLIDEVQVGLLEIKDIEKIVKLLFEAYLSSDINDEKIENVNDILDLLIKSVNHFLLN